MNVEVDRNLCESNGICVGIAPDIFDLDADDELIVAGGLVSPDRQDDVRDAVAQCPKAALRTA
ncbi:ferredoxin [Antrihabitans stalactiti]|uniref:Ferredoxin n=1 Tax=Antrihabitans stalactiti TaxID=2584121 RepID=A0A848KC39_9NOCA|nr:ferredoxin [Antrihabitans stalactiti]NMN95871.1 ferredoxin [Antrihabitans stalactiti]